MGKRNWVHLEGDAMQTESNIRRLLSFLLVGIVLLGQQASGEENVRVGLARAKQIEIRCDGPLQVAIDGRKTEGKELQAGTYMLAVVEAPDFHRAAPLVAGIVSAPPEELILTSAPGGSTESWRVELVRTPSAEVAARAERDARVKLKGRIQVSEEGANRVVHMGPFPNQYMAGKALEKARRAGFPARISTATGDLGYADMGPALTSPVLKSRRLSTQGQQPQAAPSIPSPSVPPSSETLPPAAAEETTESYEQDLAPLDLIPEELLRLDEPEAATVKKLQPAPVVEPPVTVPSPEPTVEQRVVEPMPEPAPADLGPELGWVPAPGKKSKGAPERITGSTRKLPPPPPRVGASSPRVSPPQSRPQPPVVSPRMGPPPQASAPSNQPRRVRRPRFVETPPQGERHPQVMPRKQEALPPAPPPVKAAPPPVEEPRYVTPPEDDFLLKPMPEPAPEPAYSPPPRKRLEPRVAKPAPTPEAPSQDEKIAFAPKRERFRVPGFIKSLPLIRRFWWEDPIVGPPPEPKYDIEESFASALNKPVDSEIAMKSGSAPPEGPAEPVAPLDEEKGKVEPEMLAVTPPPAESREPAPEERKLEPFEEPQTATLPKERGEPPVLELPEGELADGETSGQPLEMKSSTAQSTAAGKTLLVPPLQPVAKGTVQMFDESGQAVTDPGTVLDIVPLTSSRLEYNNNGFYGNFQAYAPGDDWLVLVNELDLEDYISGIVPQEIPGDAPFEVLKAQAVMCRCYALKLIQSGDSAEYGYDLPGDPESEWPYAGRSRETPNIRLAVEETAGEILVDPSGNLATPVYCFSSGGYVADARSVWGGTGQSIPDYLVARPDFDPAVVGFAVPENGFAGNESILEEWLASPPNTYDREAAGEAFRWKRTLSSEEMDALVNDYWNDQVGQVKTISVDARAISGHATRMTIVGSEQTVEARDSDTIREALQLDSSLIVIKENWRSGWTIYGGGLGHGVGLSQCGAIGLVKQKNANYRQILNFYFNTLKLGRRHLVRSGAGA